ncbi:hypothetical protein D3C76_938000 [compost metagenome]
MRGHHVIRQLGFEVRLEGFAQCALSGLVLFGDVADQITHQLFAARCIERQHHRFAHRCMLQQPGFDLTQLDAETANLHLMVDTPEVLHQAIGALAHQVAGAVDTPAVAGKGIGHKTFRGHARTLVITLGQAGTTDVQLAGRALRHQRQVGIENVGHAVTDHAADRHAAGAFFQHLGREAGQWHDHGFRRAVGVEEQLGIERCTNPRQVFTGQRFAASDDHAHRQCCVLGRQPLRQLAAVARGETEDVDGVATDQAADFFRVPLALGPQHHLGTAQQRHQQTLGGGVEVDRIEVQLAVVGAHGETFDHGAAMHGDFAVGHHHAFRFTGGARGVDQVGLVLRQVDVWQFGDRVVGQRRAVFFQAPAANARGQFTKGLEHRRVTEQ